jgi:hypothetical protein
MSIFKQTFPDFVQDELKSRQERIGNPSKRGELVNYQTSRNAWVRMTSGVNIVENGESDNGALAKKYVLLGGTLKKTNITITTPDGTKENTFSKKSGVGSSFDDNAYSNIGANGQPYLRGIRPMPGITNVSTSTKAAYGSLIEVVVNFQCWDIRQLEDLELLYMRPGYTVLIEWGWAPYLGSDKKLKNNIGSYDIINKTPTKEQIFKDIYDTAVKTYGGNYDAMFGYIKNYSWAARDDGGYDCSTTIISVGEVMESLKVNYSPLNAIDIIVSGGGLLQSNAESDVLKNQYSLNVLAGLFYEMWYIGKYKPDGEVFTIEDKKKNKYNCFAKKIVFLHAKHLTQSDTLLLFH